MRHVENYVRTAHRGFFGGASTLNLSRLCVASSGWAIEVPILRAPYSRPQTLSVHTRTTASSEGWIAELYLFGVPADMPGARPSHSDYWYGPLDVKTIDSRDQTLVTRRMRGDALSGSSLWYCGPTAHFTVQGMSHVAVVPMLTSTPAGFAARSGLKLDITLGDDAL